MISKVIDLNVDEHMNGASNSKGIDVRKGGGALINNNYDTLFNNYYHSVMHMMDIVSSNGSIGTSSVAAILSVSLIYLHTVSITFCS